MRKKRYKFFVIHYPNGAEVLHKKCLGWSRVRDVTDYVIEKYRDDTLIRPLRWYEVIKFLMGGQIIK